MTFTPTPFPLVVVDDYFTTQQIAKMTREATELSKQFTLDTDGGAAKKDGASLRSARASFLDALYGNRKDSFLITYSEKLLHDHKLWQKVSAQGDWFITKTLAYSNIHGTLLNAYSFGQEYQAHIDNSRLSFLITMLPTGRCEGGDLVFDEYGITLPARHNQVVVFPSVIRHAVTPIETIRGVAPARYSLALFVDLVENRAMVG